MIIIAVISILVGYTTAQFQSTTADDQQRPLKNEAFYQAAPLHYVKIGPKLAGDYKFGYDTGKGPMGQSFREEMRLADGTVKGAYGVIDGNGQKRIVHYSSGKGNFLQRLDSKSTVSLFPTIQQPSKLITQKNFNTVSLQQPIFKPSKYLQSRTTRPVTIEPIHFTPQEMIPTKLELKPAQKAKKAITSTYKIHNPTQRVNIIQPVYKSTTLPEAEQTAIATTQSPTVAQEQQDTITALAKMYKSLKRLPKTTSIPTILHYIANKVDQTDDEKSYGSLTNEDYYDSAPAFIDIERLSYSIGSDKSSSI